MCNVSADQWYFLDSQTFLNTTFPNDCQWPWMNLDRNDWYFISSTIEHGLRLSKLNSIITIGSIPIGLLSSILTMATLKRKVFSKKERFYIWMFAIAVFDFLFNLFFLTSGFNYGTTSTNLYSSSYMGTLLSKLVFESCVFAFSLSADLCSLVLTIERYCAICKSATTPNSVKPLYTILAIVVIFIGFLTRLLRYGLSYTVVQQGSSYGFEWSSTADTLWFRCLAFSCDNLLPFAMLVLMIYFSLRIASTVYKRKKSKIFDNSNCEQQKQLQKRSMAMLRLVFVLVFLFVLNQFGYCLYAITFLVNTSNDTSIGFDSTYSQVMAYMINWMAMTISIFICNLFECASRSLNFYFYYTYSASIRDEFKNLLRKSDVAPLSAANPRT